MLGSPSAFCAPAICNTYLIWQMQADASKDGAALLVQRSQATGRREQVSHTHRHFNSADGGVSESNHVLDTSAGAVSQSD